MPMTSFPLRALCCLALTACASGKPSSDGDTGEPSDSDGLAPLAPLSDDDCPALDQSGTSTFSSSGEEREATIIVPTEPDGQMGVVFFFHGLMDPASTPHPAEYMAEALDLQDVAEEHNSIVVLPVSQTMSVLGLSFFMWDAALEADQDLVLYDDLRTCVANAHDVDLKRLSVMGFSGGALWTTVILGHRSDTIAAAVEASGGSDVEVPIFENDVAAWLEPEFDTPVLLQAGGASDIWPNESFTLVDFTAATDRLESQLVEAGHFTVRCDHTSGHTMTQRGYTAAVEWVTEHTFNEPSPWSEDGLGDWDSWCVEASQ